MPRNLFGDIVSDPKRKGAALGCLSCPLDKLKSEGVVKNIRVDSVKGRHVFIWGLCPDALENETGEELGGRAGAILWKALRAVGIERSDCDVQNVVRCHPYYSDAVEPPAKALKCCSIYNAEALERGGGRADVHLVLGKLAGKQLLGNRLARAKKSAVWHDEWGAYVVVTEHPQKLLRAGSKGWLYKQFRDKMRAVAAILNNPGRFGYVKAQDYRAVETPAQMDFLKAEIKRHAARGERVSVDIEDDVIDGKRIILMVGFGMGAYDVNGTWKGKARCVVLNHPEADQSPERIDPLVESLCEIFEDASILKVFHHGSYDVPVVRKSFGCVIRGYDFDTQYAAYLWYPHLRAYGLDALVGHFHVEFGDYKLMVAKWMPHLSNAPLDTLITYNCADCDLTKRIEAASRDHIVHPLLQIYIHCAFTLGAMEKRGPILDYESHAKIADVVRPRVEKLKRDLQQMSGDPNFNPNTPQHIAKLLFDKLNLRQIAGRSTGKDILTELIATARTKAGKHACTLVRDYRQISKMDSTYLVGFMRSAELHDGQLRTVWWLTGAATGRLRSGRSDKAEVEEGVINFQNLHGNPLLKNLLVSDVDWRKAL